MSEHIVDDSSHEKSPPTSEVLCRRLLDLTDRQPFTHSAAILEGVGTSLPQHKTLEAIFNNSLRRNATTLSIRFEHSGLLDIPEIRIPLDANPDASLVIQRNPENRNFFATIRTNDKKNIIPKTRIQMEGFEDFLTRTYNITPPPARHRQLQCMEICPTRPSSNLDTKRAILTDRETHFCRYKWHHHANAKDSLFKMYFTRQLLSNWLAPYNLSTPSRYCREI